MYVFVSACLPACLSVFTYVKKNEKKTNMFMQDFPGDNKKEILEPKYFNTFCY